MSHPKDILQKSGAKHIRKSVENMKVVRPDLGQLRRLAMAVADMVSKSTGVRIAPTDLNLTPDKAKVLFPPELLEGRSRPGSFGLSVSVNPEPVLIPAPQLGKLAVPVAEIISKATGVTIPLSQLRSYIGQNGKVILPSKEELERLQKRGSFRLTISINPEPYI